MSSSMDGVLRHGGDMVPVPDLRDRWLLSKITQDNFFGREPVSGPLPAERADEDDNAHLSQLLHQIDFVYHSQGEGITINPCSTMRMRV